MVTREDQNWVVIDILIAQTFDFGVHRDVQVHRIRILALDTKLLRRALFTTHRRTLVATVERLLAAFVARWAIAWQSTWHFASSIMRTFPGAWLEADIIIAKTVARLAALTMGTLLHTTLLARRTWCSNMATERTRMATRLHKIAFC
jgi:hypothetical protein